MLNSEGTAVKNPGTHITHCCAKHGCKYGDRELCPVKNKTSKQEYPCEFCRSPKEILIEIAALQAELTFSLSLDYYRKNPTG